MTSIPFNYKQSAYKYNAGQPMGAYSSWAVFALSHHVVTMIAAMRAGLLYPTNNYVILGDDIVVRGNTFSRNYKSLISELGVDISTHKTHTSRNI